MTRAQLAEAIGRPLAWTTSALLGQPMTAAQAGAAASLLDLDEDARLALQLQPARGAGDRGTCRSGDLPVLRGAPGLRSGAQEKLIHEQRGDGITTAINFRLDVKRVPDPAGDRVVVTLDGKFLPCQW